MGAWHQIPAREPEVGDGTDEWGPRRQRHSREREIARKEIETGRWISIQRSTLREKSYNWPKRYAIRAVDCPSDGLQLMGRSQWPKEYGIWTVDLRSCGQQVLVQLGGWAEPRGAVRLEPYEQCRLGLGLGF